jgi:M6 family metalloprotease-like protein
VFIRQLILLLPLLFIACSDSGSTSITDDLQIADYNYSTDYDTSQEATKQNPMLVIRMDYADQHFVNNESSWAAKIFGTQKHQLNHYMDEISNGQFQYTPVAEGGGANDGIVTVYFTCNHPDPDINSITFASQLFPTLHDAVTAVSNYGFDFSLYDDDHNGALTPDELLIVFIMAGEEDAYSGGSPANGVWAHQWCIDGVNTTFVNGVGVMNCDTDGNYAIFGERHFAANIDNKFVPEHDATVGIIAHELGHSAFALPDLYDTDSYYGGIGYYGLMANGTWGQEGSQGYPGDTPTHMTAWSKIDVGWYSASSITNGIYPDIAVNATGTAGYNIIKVPISGSTDEYFLVENRGAFGYDEGLRVINNLYGGGIAIWHIDEAVIRAKIGSNSVNNDTSHKGVDLEEAYAPSLDTSWGDPVKNLYYLGNKTEFSPTTTPNSDSYYSSGTGITINNISAVGSTMTVDITNPN